MNPNLEQTATGIAAEKPTRARVVLAVILFITLMVSYLDRVNVSVLVADPKFLADMGIAGQPVQMGLLMTTFLFAYGISNIITGPIGDKLGPRKAMTLSIVLWGVSMAMGGMAATFGVMIAARIILGIGEGMHWPMQSSFVKNWFPPGERVKANSAWIVGIMVGPAIAMPMFTNIVSAAGWKAIFQFLLALSVVPMILIWFYTSDTPRGSKRINQAEIDHIENGLKAEQAAQAARLATAGGTLKKFYLDYQYWLIVIGFLCSASMYWGTLTWLPSYLKVARGFAWSQLGSFAALPYYLGIVTVITFGIIADRSKRKGIFPMIALTGAASCIFLGANAVDNFTSAYCMSGAVGFIGVGLPSYWAVMQSLVPASSIGSAAGLMNGVASIGSSFVPTIVGFFIAATGSYFGGLMFLVTMGSIGAVCMLILTLKKV